MGWLVGGISFFVPGSRELYVLLKQKLIMRRWRNWFVVIGQWAEYRINQSSRSSWVDVLAVVRERVAISVGARSPAKPRVSPVMLRD
jgi:hypothetical protein